MARKKKREKEFKVVRDPEQPGAYLIQTMAGETICPAVTRGGRDVWYMRAGNWRLVHMDYVEDATDDETANGEFWVREEYAFRVPCW